MQVQSLEKNYKIIADFDRRELHYSIAGFWDQETMQSFLVELGRAAKPFIEAGEAFGAVGDMSDFVTQNKETAEAIQTSLGLAQKNGMDRLALVNATPLVQLQYRRLATGLDLDFFDSVTEASTWLQRPR